MSRLGQIKYLLMVVLLVAVACKEPYDARLAPSQANYLVVEGYISANGITTITLSRTAPLTDTADIKPELNAQVSIEGEDNTGFYLREETSGRYKSDFLNLNLNQKYRLHIKTSLGGEYLSEYTPVKLTPPIDEISWKTDNNGVMIYVNSHDPQNNTRYYKWDYEETWEIHSAFASYYNYVNGSIISRNASEIAKLYYCWLDEKSTNINLGSSAHLTDDVISLAPVNHIPIESEKLSVRYSILVKQYALDQKSYAYLKMMKNNTESLGSIFDPLPSESAGNITCVSNPLEKVIGYVTISTVSEKRLFIARSEVNSTFSHGCQSTYVPPDSVGFYYDNQGLLPYQSNGTPPGRVLGYYLSSPYCIDCTLRGSNVKPSFW